MNKQCIADLTIAQISKKMVLVNSNIQPDL